MPKYVDGYLLVVPKKKVDDYRKMAEDASRIWKKCGALEYMECIGDDLSPDMGGMKILSFTKLMKLKKSETAWFSFITYRSRAHRDRVNKKVMAEMEKKYGKEAMDSTGMPFDMKRMSYGGFTVAVEA